MKEVKFNFVINCTDSELEQYKKIDMRQGVPANTFSRGNISWCLQTYLILSERSYLNVLCSNKLLKDAINIIHSDDLLNLKGNTDEFVVCVQADYPSRIWAHYHIVQNKNQLRKDSSVIYLWLQPGLVGRNPNRKMVSRVAYAGQTFNGNMVGSTESWKTLLKDKGLEFVTVPDGQWHNLSEIDILVGIRTFDDDPHNSKPPSKLFNSWHAHIPFIGGHDSAFMQVGKPGEDYLLAKTEKEVIDKIISLKNDENLYSTLVLNGKKKAEKYNNETLINDWEKSLTGPILHRYKKWKSRLAFERIRFSILIKAGLSYHVAKQIIKKVFKLSVNK